MSNNLLHIGYDLLAVQASELFYELELVTASSAEAHSIHFTLNHCCELS